MMRVRCVAVSHLGRACRCLGIALLLGFSAPAQAEYRVQAGDVLEIVVAGLPQLNQRVPVQMDGNITVPLIGTFDVEGDEIGAVRSRIQLGFASQVLSVFTSNGREISRVFDREDVGVMIVEYRPIWIAGDVAAPGAQKYEQRMTVRQGIASAGGLRAQIGEFKASPFSAIELRNEYTEALVGLAAQTARAWRLQAELGNPSEFDRSGILADTMIDATLDQILAFEEEMRSVRLRDFEREKKFLRESIAIAQEQIASLSEQLDKETKGEAEDQEEYERTQELLKQGKLTTSRMIDSRRLALYSATRTLQTNARLMQVRERLSEHERALEKIDDRRRIEILAELVTVEASIKLSRATLSSVEEKLRIAGVQLPRAGSAEPEPDFVVIRKIKGTVKTLTAQYDDELQPGDVVQVTWRTTSPMDLMGEIVGQASAAQAMRGRN